MAVFHLKYRPQKLSDLDLPDVAEVLKKYLLSEDTPQSFLFTGPKGAGKTSAARIVARALNCLQPNGVEPCGECENCKEVLNSSSLDIIEIDAASNRGIEDIRTLKERAYLLPSKLKKKVFIIDEVHMLTKEAFNALLKLIEEPPKHTVFILCTTDSEKIPDTVLSRLIKVDFRKGNKKELTTSIKRVIDGENIKIDKEAIDMIVEKSDGSFRNLQRTFNEIYLLYGKIISLENVKTFFVGKGGNYNSEEFEADLIKGDVKIILEKLEKMAEKGVDFSSFRHKLLAYFQAQLLSFFGVGDSVSNQKISAPEVERFINLLVVAGRLEKDVEIDQLPLELAVIDFLGDNGQSKKQDLDKVEKESDKVNSEDEVKKNDEFEIKAINTEEPPIIVSNVNTISLKEIEKDWGNVLIVVKPYNHSIEAFLRASKPKKVQGDVLELEVFYPFHKDRLEEAKNRKIVEAGLLKVYGVNLGFECVLSKNKKEPLVIQNNTPIETVTNQVPANEEKKDIYDVAKEIFG